MWISFFSDVKTLNVLLWFCLYCSSIYFLVKKIVCHVSKCSSNLHELDSLQFILTHVQGMYTAMRIMHFFSFVTKFDEALKLYTLVRIGLWEKRCWHWTPWCSKGENPQLSMPRGWDRRMLLSTVWERKRSDGPATSHHERNCDRHDRDKCTVLGKMHTSRVFTK